eukprot:CAMPEP_0178918232 /NCGR_PEP_ID=MMETSP0786-20121207/13715_1 /TAXON_ID=186022 /ORGANISM="Thalassionema frauenfeldii, Strain CCMP 1798" /LENGTH=70 /DNA_ID=CAMNT_0020591925 /DNA_START=162 /DNA_END=371 /DNA_ORIENTATION=+
MNKQTIFFLFALLSATGAEKGEGLRGSKELEEDVYDDVELIYDEADDRELIYDDIELVYDEVDDRELIYD